MEKNIAIKVEDVSKMYRLGRVNSGSFGHDVKRWWAKVRGQEDPFSKVAVENDRTQKTSSDYVWALKDISFEVEKGDVLGIVGRNGAGKSTLLKLLTRVTLPTTGSIKAKGRIASLLEVGTGFHPDLTGRENIFLNGAILGMTKQEIKRKFDEIVDFSGVERYIDTPVKRYSSGMYVRLAFGVAAHLESEILIIDEVLAVGDTEFQKKCLGKMGDVAKNEGRTVLFVSHNMTAVKSLCSKVAFMSKGKLVDLGETNSIIDLYQNEGLTGIKLKQKFDIGNAPGNDSVRMLEAEIVKSGNNVSDYITVKDSFSVFFKFKINDFCKQNETLNLSLHLFTATGECVFNIITKPEYVEDGVYESFAQIPGNFMNDGIYLISMMVVKDASILVHNFEDILQFEIIEDRLNSAWHGKWLGSVRPAFIEFELQKSSA